MSEFLPVEGAPDQDTVSPDCFVGETRLLDRTLDGVAQEDVHIEHELMKQAIERFTESHSAKGGQFSTADSRSRKLTVSLADIRRVKKSFS